MGNGNPLRQTAAHAPDTHRATVSRMHTASFRPMVSHNGRNSQESIQRFMHLGHLRGELIGEGKGDLRAAASCCTTCLGDTSPYARHEQELETFDHVCHARAKP